MLPFCDLDSVEMQSLFQDISFFGLTLIIYYSKPNKIKNITQKSWFFGSCNFKYKNYPNFYKFFLLLPGDGSLNPGPIQRSPDKNYTIWEALNKKGLHF